MGALDLASVAAQALGDASDSTIFALCHDHGIRLIPCFGVGICRVVDGALRFDPSPPLPELCHVLLLAFSRWLVPTGTDQDVADLAELLNARLCQPDHALT